MYHLPNNNSNCFVDAILEINSEIVQEKEKKRNYNWYRS